MKTLITFIVFVCAATGLMAQSSTLPTEPYLLTESQYGSITFENLPGHKVDSIVTANYLPIYFPSYSHRDFDITDSIKYHSTLKKSGVWSRGEVRTLDTAKVLNEAQVSYVNGRKVYHWAAGSATANGLFFGAKRIHISSSGKLFFINKDKSEVLYSLDKQQLESEKESDGYWFINFCNMQEDIDGLILEYSEDISEIEGSNIEFISINHIIALGRVREYSPINYLKKKARR